jgi:diguanylate cyclase (GGDEF)-like protein/PAS domain S-box-containing protein
MGTMKFPRSRSSRTSAAVALACALIIGVVWVVTYERVTFERESDIAEALKQNENLALAFEQHAVRALRGIDMTLRLLRHEHEQHGGKIDSSMLEAVTELDYATYSFLGIVDASGYLIAGTGAFKPTSVTDQTYFKHHLHSADSGMRVALSAERKSNGAPELQMSRRVNLPDGSFGGVVIAGVNPGQFTSFYERVNLGSSGLVQLVSMEGDILVRRTQGAASAGQNLRGSTLVRLAAASDADTFLAGGRVDGVQRHMSYRVLRDFGVIVSVGTSTADAIASAQKRQWWYLLGSSLATVFVVFFGSGIVLALRRQQRATEAARAGESLYRVTFEQAAVGIAHNSLDGRFTRANGAYCAMLGYTEDELRARTFMDVLHPDDVPSPETMHRVLQEGGIKEEERFVRKDGSVRSGLVAVALVRDAAGKPDYFVAMVQDVTERNEAQARLLRQSHYDTLTGLPNRLLLLDRLTQTLNQARRKEQTVGALLINLDRFKAVNDTLGRDCGDQLLRVAAERLTATVRAGDSVARTGGDEFVIVLPEIHGAEDAARVARKVVDAMTAPYRIGEQEIFVTASVGIALFPGDGPEAEALIRNADAAMARAKEVGRNNFQFYTATLNERSTEKLLLEADLRRALGRDEFLLHYQPKVNLASGTVTGMEALLRWRRADGKLVSPGEFIPLLEESGMIGEVGNWVIHAACAQIQNWRRAGYTPVPVAVNVSTQQFLQGDLHAVVDRALRESGVEPGLLEIEITESDAMQDHERVVPVLNALKARGVGIAIDDFGTGYSSLGYLARFPVQTLKIDRSFIIRMHTEANAMTLVSTMISLAHSLNLKVIAEGVETDEHSSLLRLLRCDEMQGYLFSRPLPAGDCTRYLDAADAVANAELPAELAAA